jgi:outer membrane protein W
MAIQKTIRRSTTFVVATILLLAPVGSADAGEKNWRVRLMGAIEGGSHGVVTSGGPSGAGVSIDGGGGVGFNFEHRYSPKMGFEMGAMAIGATVSAGVWKSWPEYDAGVEIGSYVPITFGFNYHPLKNTDTFDLFVGPLMATVIQSRVVAGTVVDVGSQTDFGLGANFGADINLGKSRWSLNAAFKYISILTDSGDSDSFADFDPLIFTFGVGFRF